MAERAIEWASLVREESEALREAARQLREPRDDAIGAFRDERAPDVSSDACAAPRPRITLDD